MITQDSVAIDGFPMCDSCLDDEFHVGRMALAQSDSAENCNMEPRWIPHPDLPYDPVDKIKHCACVLVSTKFIPAGTKLSWHYPMVQHQVSPPPPPIPLLPPLPPLSLFLTMKFQASPTKLQAKPPYLKTPLRKTRERHVFTLMGFVCAAN